MSRPKPGDIVNIKWADAFNTERSEWMDSDGLSEWKETRAICYTVGYYLHKDEIYTWVAHTVGTDKHGRSESFMDPFAIPTKTILKMKVLK